MTNRVLELTEEEPQVLPSSQLGETQARMIHDTYPKEFEIVPIPFAVPPEYRVRSLGWVGTFPVDEQIQVHVRPKVPVGSLFAMLEYAYDLKSFQFLAGLSDADSLEDVFEHLAKILARRVLDRARKGLYRGYVEEQDDLPYLRGRMQIVPTLRRTLRGATSIHCDYEEHTADLDDNRILAWALYRLSRMPIRREDVRRLVRCAYRTLATSVEVREMLPEACLNRFYDRLNEDYRPLHALCRFFLEQCGPRAERGGYRFLPFKVSMPRLFESFVLKWLQAHEPEGVHIQGQFTAHLDPGHRLSFRIDILLTDRASSRVLAVMDTKYKREGLPSLDDISQVVAYAARMETSRAILIYPSVGARCETFYVGPVEVCVLVFDVEKPIEDGGVMFLKALLSAVA